MSYSCQINAPRGKILADVNATIVTLLMHFTTFRNLGKSGLRVSCLGLGEWGRIMQIIHYSLNFYFESLISLRNVNVKNVNGAACLIILCFVVGTWVTFGSQITDKVGRKEYTCIITLLSEAS